MSSGRIVQIIGAVIDVEFERENVPQVYDALTVDGTEITLEVQQQLGDGVVRTIALGSTEGLKPGPVSRRYRCAGFRTGRYRNSWPHHGCAGSPDRRAWRYR